MPGMPPAFHRPTATTIAASLSPSTPCPPVPLDLGQCRRVISGPHAGRVAVLKADDGFVGEAFWCWFVDAMTGEPGSDGADWVLVVDLGGVAGC